MSDLKPCPCCGSDAVGITRGTVHCFVCHLEVRKHSRELAISIWNSRPYENKLKAEAVREAVNYVSDEHFNGFDFSEKGLLLSYAAKLEGGEL